MLSYFIQWYRYLSHPAICKSPVCNNTRERLWNDTCCRACQLTIYEIDRREEREARDRNYEKAEKDADRYMDSRSTGAR